MASNGDLMRKALKRFLLPQIADLGFVGKPVSFHRVKDNYHDLLSLQYWKYGGEFILEFARRERGPFVTSWGPVIPEEKLEIGYIDVLQRARLEQCGPRAGKGFHGFDFSHFGGNMGDYDALAQDVAALLPEMDDWLNHGRKGEHINPFRKDD